MLHLLDYKNCFLLLSLALQSFVCAHGRTTTMHHDLVNITTINPTIKLDIRYATENNFTKKVIYSSAQCYLRRAVAKKLDNIQKELATQGLGLKIFDGYRPLRFQQRLWNLCPDERYVAHPQKGSKHNRGSAVDLTLINLKTGQELEMPSEFDDFTEQAHRTYETMSEKIKHNCKLLEAIMVKHGFTSIYEEWWHFNDASWQKYDLLDISFKDLEKEK